MEGLTNWTASLASSVLHLKGLSQQETFLLNKKKNHPKKKSEFPERISLYMPNHICTSHTYTLQGVLPPTNLPFNPSTIRLLLH